MNAQELFFSNGLSAEIWFCSACKKIAKTKDQAAQCCKKNNCRICGEPVDTPHWVVHRGCSRNEQIEKAEKLESWDDWVYLEGFSSEYFVSVGDLLDELENDGGVEIPEYVFVCKPIPFRTPDIEDLINNCLDGHYDDAYDNIAPKSYAALSDALDAFRLANRHIVSYEPDFTKMAQIGKFNERP